MTERVHTEEHQKGKTLGILALAAACFLVLGAALVFVWSGVTTASGRIAATTSNDSSLINAAVIDLVVTGSVEDSASGILIDADGLYPGLVVERCIEVTYWGDLAGVPVRMFGAPEGGTGLEAFVNTTVERGSGAANDCSDFATSGRLFDGTLLEFWNRHGSFEAGVPLMPAADNGARTWLRIAAELADDNNAQGLTTTFWLTLEARP